MLNVKSGRKLKRKNDSNIITAINRKNDLRIFIFNSTPGFQFSLIVLFAIARKYYHNNIRKDSSNNNQRVNNNFVFEFSSREFRDTYSKLAYDLGLSRHLVREIAFPEYTLTLLYLGFIREKEDTGEYEFSLSLDESKWLASVALNIIETGIRSPIEQDTGISSRNLRSNQEIEGLINEIVLTKPSSHQRRDKEEEQSNSEKLVTPRSRDYGKGRPSYIPNKQPPTTYSLRKKLSPDEINRLEKEFIGETCEDCGRKILLDDFDIWIGEPMRRTPSKVQDQRMSDILADSTTITKDSANNNITMTLDSKIHSTDREILELGYGILPMDGRNGFIAFAKPIRNCPICGYNTWNSMSVSPNF
ncbi:MAG: hypothetical protein K0S91_1085 [Nitrososphaeraceae archaeon]|nr:hypothetical protein [Nitrososphaeraceae archaeon]